MPQEKPLAKLRLFVYKVTMGTARGTADKNTTTTIKKREK